MSGFVRTVMKGNMDATPIISNKATDKVINNNKPPSLRSRGERKYKITFNVFMRFNKTN